MKRLGDILTVSPIGFSAPKTAVLEHFWPWPHCHIFGANLNRNFHFLGLSWPFPIDLQSGVMGPLTGGVRRWSSGLRRQDYYWKQQQQQENPTLLCFSQVPSRLRSSVPLDFGISVINGFFGVALCEVCSKQSLENWIVLVWQMVRWPFLDVWIFWFFGRSWWDGKFHSLAHLSSKPSNFEAVAYRLASQVV